MSSVLEAHHIVKKFPGTLALDDINVSFESGKVHALVGKNGSGKSTLLKIFSGAHAPTEGEIVLDSEKIEKFDTTYAMSKGIATVYQELSLIPTLTVTENILINRIPVKKGGLLDWHAARENVRELLKQLEIEISPDAIVGDLSMWQMQMIEIAKAMSFHPKVLLLDEPTSSLAKHEVESLFKIIRSLKEKDVIIIYVSHKLDELWQVADTCTVLRDGRLIGKVMMQETSHSDLINMMFGQVSIPKRPDDLMVSDEVVLEVKNLTRRNKFENISFQLKKGEILGIAGMLGSGRTELLKSIFGADPFHSGEIIFRGEHVKSANLIRMKKLGMALTPEDRKHEGLILDAPIGDNLCYASLEALTPNGMIDKAKQKQYIDRQVENLQIKVADTSMPVSDLSGGNQQKVVVGNWLNTDPSVIIFDEPSRGIDINAKQQIFKIIWEQSRKGVSCIMVSTELEELLEVCQRILIMQAGKFVGEVIPDELTNEQLYTYCMGGM
ncbi:sugar ABC transporter ATP-binding protein [Christensenella intestinihominis]|uniref:sugar ABC transporter ATP-binding protein n=1 Tax=Christensenella intestinihominis TaxID=1851429 RepID=UPI00082D4F16|nr:sugar ABC transporter ATP-binding protein [Christensenella intestinihominis]